MTTLPAVSPSGTELPVAAEFIKDLYHELRRAFYEPVWVMDLDWYRKIRGAMVTDDDDDPDKWEPSIDDRLLGYRICVRFAGGKPHMERMTPGEIETVRSQSTG
jgi:hypothetical protein